MDFEELGGCFVVVVALIVCVFAVISFVGGLVFDFEAGSHRIIPTAMDTDMFGNYKVYFKTNEYTKNNEEDYYYIDKNNKEIAEQMQEYIKKGTEVVVYYDKYVGFKGFTAPKESPIVRIEEVAKDN